MSEVIQAITVFPRRKRDFVGFRKSKSYNRGKELRQNTLKGADKEVTVENIEKEPCDE